MRRNFFKESSFYQQQEIYVKLKKKKEILKMNSLTWNLLPPSFLWNFEAENLIRFSSRLFVSHEFSFQRYFFVPFCLAVLHRDAYLTKKNVLGHISSFIFHFCRYFVSHHEGCLCVRCSYFDFFITHRRSYTYGFIIDF